MDIELDNARRPLQLRVPFLRPDAQIGAGDVVQKITGMMGVKPCTPCEERKKKLNQMLRFQGWKA